MLRLRFYTPGETSAGSIEPASFFRLIGSMLCRGPNNEPVATHDGGWLLSDGRFPRAESMDPVVIYFEDNAGRASTAYGPFAEFHVAENTAWTGNRMLARLDEKTLLWYPPKAQDGWASLLIAPPDKSRFDLISDRPGSSPADASARRHERSVP